MLADMSKVIYAKVPDEVHAYLLEAAEEAGLPVNKTLEAIIRSAHAAGWQIRPAFPTAGPREQRYSLGEMQDPRLLTAAPGVLFRSGG
jgi:hypothetical protein